MFAKNQNSGRNMSLSELEAQVRERRQALGPNHSRTAPTAGSQQQPSSGATPAVGGLLGSFKRLNNDRLRRA